MVRKTIVSLVTIFCAACTTTKELPPLDKVSRVDMQRFMGDWYVIANIPTFLEKGAYNAIEHYDLQPDGSVAIRFTFYKDAFDGPLKTLTMTGTPVDGTNNAEWKVSPFWPLKFPYYTVELADDYSWVVVATPNRGYLWIMSRQPEMSGELLKEITDRMVARGFNPAEIQKIPQKWPSQPARP
jgi:apolipoprotein D and lipocalin family protein